jgi:non-specific serine/threonine protein kinase/serine/threonine-protein kinase
MTPERWARVTELFEQATQQPAAERLRWLDGVCDDAAVRAEVEAMLAAYDTDPEFLEQPTDAAGAMEEAVADALVGRRLGAYRLVRQVGRGGMGVVYEAQRDDQEFDRRAAVKVLPVWRSASFGERFRFERRVLAGLDHPGIARLIDAGTTPDGVTYVVLEYIDGQPVTTWCQGRTIAEQVALAERICEAVTYAHQRLVIHRDLKPANILVTAEGQPKLLDFGIAALVADDGASRGTTRTGQHSFTPEFASPEQVRGERVTTATDVYSLGVLLYVMLTGRAPYSLSGLTPLQVIQTICDVDPPAPSAGAPPQVQSLLHGDLDAVLLKALRKHPADRYGSVAEFAADLRAWRTGHPVSAAPASMTYRARRFVSRNRKAVAAATAVVVALAAGGAATLWQARIAQLERDKAQNRFRQIQEFSRSLLFDVHDALRNVPGATEARRLLLDRAVTFLDGLAADAGDDPALELELAAAYQQLAKVQGNQFSENVGDTAGAVASLRKAVRYIDALHRDDPADTRVLTLAVHIHFDLAAILSERVDTSAKDEQAVHAALVYELETRHGADPETVAVVASGYSDIGRLRVDGGDIPGGGRAYERSVALYDSLPPGEHPLSVVRAHAFALKRLGAVLLREGDFGRSEQRYRQALALDEEAARRDDRPAVRYDITFTMSDLALVQSRLGHWDEAEAMWLKALALRRQALEDDPKNARARSGVATLYGRLGRAATARRNYAGAERWYREEVSTRGLLVQASEPLPGRVAEMAWARLRLAEALVNRADAERGHRERSAWIAEARRLFATVQRADGGASVTAGSPPGFHELFDQMRARLAAPLG